MDVVQRAILQDWLWIDLPGRPLKKARQVLRPSDTGDAGDDGDVGVPNSPRSKPWRWMIQPSRPRDQVFDASCGQQGALRIQGINAQIFWEGYKAVLPELLHTTSVRPQPDRADTGNRAKRRPSFFDISCLVQVRDAFLGDYVAHVVAVNHDWSNWHS